MRWAFPFIVVAIVLVSPLTVKAAEPAVDSATLTLDASFAGHPVSFDLLDGRVTVAWDAKTLVAPSEMTVSLGQAVTSTNDQQIAAPAVIVSFADPAAIGPRGAFQISVKAYRPPSSTEANEANVMVPTTSTIAIVQGTFAKDRVTFTVPAAPAVTVSPTYRDGIMKQGMASWYAYKKCLCAASPDVPKGTRMIVRRADDPSRFVVVTINDWGPERDKHPERVIDLDKVAFAKIGNPRGGVMAVTVDVVPPEDPLWKLADAIPPPNLKKLLAQLNK
jgi:hypothetical protein